MKNNIISPVKKLVEKAIKENYFQPMDYSYPGFTISQENHIDLLAQIIQTRVHNNFARGDYKSKNLLNPGEDFNSLVQSEITGKTNNRFIDILEKTLPSDIEKDVAFAQINIQSLSRTAVLKGISTHIKANIMDISLLKNSFPDEHPPLEAERKIDKLAASLIYISKTNPIAYREIENELELNPIVDIVADLKKEIANPSQTTLYLINDFDSKFVQEHFTKQAMIMANDKEIANKIFKMRQNIPTPPKPSPFKRFFSFS